METMTQVAWLMKAKELYNIQAERKALSDKEEVLAKELRALSNNESMAFGGMKYYTETRLGGVDYSSIPELKSVDLDQYRKAPVKVWKIAVEKISL